LTAIWNFLLKIFKVVGGLGGSIPYIGTILRFLPLLTEIVKYFKQIKDDWEDEDVDEFIREEIENVKKIRQEDKEVVGD